MLLIAVTGLEDEDPKELLARLAAWMRADSPAAVLGPELVVLDEGALAASATLWERVRASTPRVVAIAVREAAAAALAERLGQPFDLTVRVGDPAAWARLQEACLASRDWTRVGLFGAAAGTFEMTLGAALHGGLVPFRGLVMASAQATVMTFAAGGLGRRGRVVWVPFIAAGLKALSPAGNRLRPMLAITVQGLLYAGASRLLGWNAVGATVASALVGAWAAAQGLILQYLLVGSALLKAYKLAIGFVAGRLGLGTGLPAVILAVGGWIALWALVSGTVGALAYRRARRGGEEAFLARCAAWRARFGAARRGAERQGWGAALKSGARDLLRPAFWAPVGLVAAVILASGAPWGEAFWIVARAVTVGMLLFTAVRLLDVRGLARALRRRGSWGPALALSRAVDEVFGPADGR